MKVVTSLNQIPPLEKPIALSIGVYDGVHLGHQAILKNLQKVVKKGGQTAVLTFSNHPSIYLTPNSPIPLIISLEHRLKLFEEMGIDLAIVLPFNQSFAAQSYEDFFSALKTHLPFDNLIVGDDARFGKGRAGGPEEIKRIGIAAYYLQKEMLGKQPISSKEIRSYIEKGDLKRVKKMLGRPYSLILPYDHQSVIRENDVQFKWETGTKKLCLLPSAVYAVDLKANGKTIPAIAFYRSTQTIERETQLSLSIIYEKPLPAAEMIEVAFIAYLHDELDPELRSPSKRTLLQTLKPELFPS
ncbi:MAG: hypothetical protein KDK60_03165 [Chlamydiia bacterium]|nr:hypothetical protein [Chlamydiia bacterium]